MCPVLLAVHWGKHDKALGSLLNPRSERHPSCLTKACSSLSFILHSLLFFSLIYLFIHFFTHLSPRSWQFCGRSEALSGRDVRSLRRKMTRFSIRTFAATPPALASLSGKTSACFTCLPFFFLLSN